MTTASMRTPRRGPAKCRLKASMGNRDLMAFHEQLKATAFHEE